MALIGKTIHSPRIADSHPGGLDTALAVPRVSVMKQNSIYFPDIQIGTGEERILSRAGMPDPIGVAHF
jgi:hypothetical protein